MSIVAAGSPRRTVFWVVSSTDRSNAGFRVRTAPIVSALIASGLDVQTITYAELGVQLTSVMETASAVVLAKPSDTAAYLCMRVLADKGVKVVVDLFDNYFSWSALAMKRQVHWHWLRNLRTASLAVTSTAYMEAVVRSLHAGSVLRVSDPLPMAEISSDDELASAGKWPLRRHLDVLWFGIADNPYFHAGLTDLCDWHLVLRALVDALADRLEVRLTVCTSRAPALDSALATLRDEGIDAQFVEWSDQTCTTLLSQAHLVLLPTNTTGFSLAKTHNRCSDALARDCLALGSPRGPYAGIGGAVFLDIGTLTRLLVSAPEPQQIKALTQASRQRLSEQSNTVADTKALCAALTKKKAQPAKNPSNDSWPRVLVVATVDGSTAKLARTLGFLCAGFPDGQSRITLDFALTLVADAVPGRIAKLVLSTKAWNATLASLQAKGAPSAVETATQWLVQSAGWRLVLIKANRTCTVLAGPGPQLKQQLAAARVLRSSSVFGTERWYGARVALLVRVLQVLGLDRLEFAADEGTCGWAAFSAHANPSLAAAERQLNELWLRHAGHEDEWTAATLSRSA